MAGTDQSQSIEFRPSPAVILCEPQLGENIGTAARAMANFGLWDLRLVNPRDGWPNIHAVRAASRADHVLDKVRVFTTLPEAIADLELVYATTARSRDLQKDVFGPETATTNLTRHIAGGGQAGILFGRERFGLLNEEIALADAIVTFPVEPAFASLNIAQAVLLMAYQWRQQTEGGTLPFTAPPDSLPATKEELIGMFEHLEGILDTTGFFTSADKRVSMIHNLRTMLGRASFTAQEVRTFRGLISSIDRKHQRPNPNRPRRPRTEPPASS